MSPTSTGVDQKPFTAISRHDATRRYSSTPEREPSARDVVRSIDKALSLMNGEGGAHWIKSSYRGMRWFRRLVKGKNRNRYTERQELCYCALGAIDEVTLNRPRLKSRVIAEIADEIAPYSRGVMWRSETESEAVIWGFNDSRNTSWRNIVSVFRSRSRRIKKEGLSS